MNYDWLNHQLTGDERAMGRKTVLPFILWLIVLAVVLLIVLPRNAQSAEPVAGSTMIFTDPELTLRLYDKACESERVKPHVKPERLGELKAAEGDFRYMDGNRKVLAGCWKYFEKVKGLPGAVYGAIFEDGDMLQLDADKFSQDGL